jgi:hypothetical protein
MKKNLSQLAESIHRHIHAARKEAGEFLAAYPDAEALPDERSQEILDRFGNDLDGWRGSLSVFDDLLGQDIHLIAPAYGKEQAREIVRELAEEETTA